MRHRVVAGGDRGRVCVSWAVPQGALLLGRGKCSILLGSKQGCGTGLVAGGQRFPSPSQAGPGRCYPMWDSGSLADLAGKTRGLWGRL